MSVGVNGIAPGAAIGMPTAPGPHDADVHGHRRLRFFKTKLLMIDQDYWETVSPSQGFDEKRISRKRGGARLPAVQACPRCGCAPRPMRNPTPPDPVPPSSNGLWGKLGALCLSPECKGSDESRATPCIQPCQTVSEPHLLHSLELLFERKQILQIVLRR